VSGFLLALALAIQADARPIVVASKPFGESYLLAEMFAQLLEARGHRVERRLGLGATEIAFAAIRSGAADVYPEYTGTGLLAILGERPNPDAQAVYAQVSREFHDRFGMRWLPPLGFENTYAIAVRRQTAESLGLTSLSDLGKVGPRLRAGLTPDFIGREDGLPGLARAYQLRFAAVRALLSAVKYRALAAGEVDVIDGYSTDGLIARYDLVVLRDDRAFFPPYQAAALVGRDLAEHQPAAVAALTELSGRLDVGTMRHLNRRVEVDGQTIAAVARAALDQLGLIASGPPSGRSGSRRAGVVAYLWEQRWELISLTGRHLLLVAVSLVAAIGLAVPLGLGLERLRRGAESVIRGIGLL
jgi:osmoprotectant transport system permease protein